MCLLLVGFCEVEVPFCGFVLLAVTGLLLQVKVFITFWRQLSQALLNQKMNQSQKLLTVMVCRTVLACVICVLLYLDETRALQPVATCRQLLCLHKPAIVIVTSFSLSRLWRLQPASQLFSL